MKKIFSKIAALFRRSTRTAELPQDELPDELRGVVFTADQTEADDEILAAAKRVFKIQHLMPWQRLVIGNILDAAADLYGSPALDGSPAASEKFAPNNPAPTSDDDFTDVFCLGRQIVLLPTGAGKSLCFLLPAVLLPRPTLIFYPLLALMSDQARRIESSGIECVVFRGGQSEEEREENFRRIKEGAKIILANPEVLQSDALVKQLRECNIGHIAIDEAHCVAEWGDTFRPAYLTLGKIIADLGVPLVTAFTATASPQILERISEVLFGGRAHIVRGESDRPNIHYQVHYAWSKKKAACRLAATQEKPMIIFCGTRAKSEDMARELRECIGGDKVRFYHAGLSREEKSAVEKWFFPKDDAILCCTCAFGMGVDKPNVRTVIHLEPSPTAESYVQEAGRGGRDKKVANAILLWSKEDSDNAEKFGRNSREYAIKKFAESATCRRQVLLDILGGEQAICSGCDICEGRGKAASNNISRRKRGKTEFVPPTVYDAQDAKAVFKFIRKNQNYYSKNQVIGFVKKKFNLQDAELFGINIWTSEDLEKIIEQLKKCGTVYSAGVLWKYNLAAKKHLHYYDPPKTRCFPIRPLPFVRALEC